MVPSNYPKEILWKKWERKEKEKFHNLELIKCGDGFSYWVSLTLAPISKMRRSEKKIVKGGKRKRKIAGRNVFTQHQLCWSVWDDWRGEVEWRRKVMLVGLRKVRPAKRYNPEVNTADQAKPGQTFLQEELWWTGLWPAWSSCPSQEGRMNVVTVLLCRPDGD